MNGRVNINGRWYDASACSKNGVWRVSDLPDAPDSLVVLRVIYSGHPGFQDALQGLVRPWGSTPPVDAQKVQLQTAGTRPNTGLTSWSTDKNYTMRLALKGDLILAKRVHAHDAILPPNAIGGESEVLLHGPVRNCKVIRK